MPLFAYHYIFECKGRLIYLCPRCCASKEEEETIENSSKLAVNTGPAAIIPNTRTQNINPKIVKLSRSYLRLLLRTRRLLEMGWVGYLRLVVDRRERRERSRGGGAWTRETTWRRHQEDWNTWRREKGNTRRLEEIINDCDDCWSRRGPRRHSNRKRTRSAQASRNRQKGAPMWWWAALRQSRATLSSTQNTATSCGSGVMSSVGV